VRGPGLTSCRVARNWALGLGIVAGLAPQALATPSAASSDAIGEAISKALKDAAGEAPSGTAVSLQAPVSFETVLDSASPTSPSGEAGGSGRAGRNPSSGASPPVTLTDALRQALRPDNPTLEQQSDNVAAAAARARAAKGQFDWTVNASGGWQEFYGPKVNSAGLLTDQTTTANIYSYTANIGKLFRNGIAIDPGITAYPGSGVTPAQTAGLTQIRPMLGLKIPLLRGRGQGAVDANERAAIDALGGARNDSAFANQQFAANVAKTFWRCLADDAVLSEAQAVNAHAAHYGSILTRMLRKGLIEPTVVQQWSANNVSQQLNVDRAQDETQKCRRDLGYALTGRVDQPWPSASGEMPSVEALAAEVDKLDENALAELALGQREDLKAAGDRLQASREQLRGAKDATKPELDIHIDPLQATIGFSKSLGNNAAEGREAEATAQADQADLALRQLEDQVRIQVGDAVTDLRRAAADWTALDAAAKQMDVVVATAEKRAAFGTINWGDFLNAQNQASELHRQVIYQRLAFADALATLQLLTGSIDPDHPALLATNLSKLPTP
jgi:outer membrane protein TolC